MVDWNEVTAVATAAAAIVAIVAVIVTALQQREALADQVQALASVQRRAAYSSLLSAMFRVSEFVNYRWSEEWVKDQLDTALPRNLTPERATPVADGALRKSGEDVIVEIVCTESSMGIEPYRQSAVVEPFPEYTTVGDVVNKVNLVSIKFSLALGVSERAVLNQYSENKTLAILAGAPTVLMTKVDGIYGDFRHEAEHPWNCPLESVKTKDATKSRTDRLQDLQKEMTNDLQPEKKQPGARRWWELIVTGNKGPRSETKA